MESCKGEQFAHHTICNLGVKISCRGRSDIKEHHDTTKHSENLHIRNHITFFFAFIFNVTCF